MANMFNKVWIRVLLNQAQIRITWFSLVWKQVLLGLYFLPLVPKTILRLVPRSILGKGSENEKVYSHNR